MADDEQQTSPPYAPWSTVLHLLERMERESVPARIDKTYLVGMAGGTQSQVKHALKSLGLIASNDEVTPSLHALATNPDDRPKRLADILHERFPRLVALGESATRGQLDEALGEYGLTGATVRKAASFYVSSATYAGIPLSPHIKPSRGTASNGSRGTVKRRRRNPAGSDDRQEQRQPVGTDMKRVYFDLLVGKVKESDGLDTDLLDRIERLVGLDGGGDDKTKD